MKKMIPMVIAALALGLPAGCGGGDDGSKVPSLAGAPAASASADTAAQGKAFAECLRANGLDVPDPDPRTGRIDRKALQGVDRSKAGQALEACRDKMPQQNTELEKLRNPDAETKAKMVAFAQCMRDEGQDFADPGPDGFDFTTFTRGDEAFRDAAETCLKKHPFVNPGAAQ